MEINELVSVELVDRFPICVVWKGNNYKISKIGLHHTFREGRTLCHIFSVTSDNLFLRLKFDTDSLLWKLMEVESAV